jgi:hypothetical protein
LVVKNPSVLHLLEFGFQRIESNVKHVLKFKLKGFLGQLFFG